MTTKVEQFFAELDGGVLEQKLSHMLSETAAAVIDHNRSGEVTIKLKMKRIGQSHQVQIDHAVKYSRPTSKGSVQEDNTTSTPMYVGKGGALTLFPEDQTQMFDKKGQVNDRTGDE